jgi:hypothetical protein
MAVLERGVGFGQMIPDKDFYETVRLYIVLRRRDPPRAKV